MDIVTPARMKERKKERKKEKGSDRTNNDGVRPSAAGPPGLREKRYESQPGQSLQRIMNLRMSSSPSTSSWGSGAGAAFAISPARQVSTAQLRTHATLRDNRKHKPC